jgi:drug/metabolite transporter (DMT)-like permease
LAVLFVALGASLWGTDTVLRRPLAGALPPLVVVLYEHAILTLVLAPVAWVTRAQWKQLRLKQWGAMLGIAWGGSALATWCFTEAVRLDNPTKAVLLQKTQPLFAVVLATVLLGERLARRFWLYLAAAIIAAYAISFGDRDLLAPLRSGLLNSRAALLAAAAAALWGSSTVLGRFVVPNLTFAAITTLRILLAFPFLLAIVLLTRAPLPLPGGTQALALLVMALVPGLAALLLYYRGLRDTPASLAAVAELAFPATAMLLNWLFLSARVTPLQFAGFATLWLIIGQLERER